MHLDDLEEQARALDRDRQRLDEIEEELESVIAELRDLPKQAEREGRFAKLVGADALSGERLREMEDRKQALADEREKLREANEEGEVELVHGFLSEDLVVPLTTEPVEKEREWVFPFRNGRTYPHAIGFLGRTLGLGNPLALEGVLISEEGVRVPIEFDIDESEAMESVVAAFDQVQNALGIKVPQEAGW